MHYWENFLFLFFLFLWSFVDVNDFILNKSYDMQSHILVIIVLLLVGFSLEIFNVSLNCMGLGAIEIPKFSNYFLGVYFWFNRFFLWIAYLLRYVLYSSVHNVQSTKSLDYFMSVAIPIVWLLSHKFIWHFIWYSWRPFIIILKMNK